MVEDMNLEAEIVEVKSREARRMTLYEHGASREEVTFLAPYDEAEECRRVELNAMTSRQIVDFVEDALAAHDVEKVVPTGDVLEQQARHRLQIKLTNERLAEQADEIAQQVAAMARPEDLAAQIRELRAGSLKCPGIRLWRSSVSLSATNAGVRVQPVVGCACVILAGRLEESGHANSRRTLASAGC